MKITFLGTNGWYDTETSNTVCILIETKKDYIILDAGNGIYKIPRFIGRRPSSSFLCKSAFELADKADLLITECSYKPGEKHAKWPHLNPQEAAKIAKVARSKELILTHFDAGRYPKSKERQRAERNAAHIFNNVFAAVDNMQIQL